MENLPNTKAFLMSDVLRGLKIVQGHKTFLCCGAFPFIKTLTFHELYSLQKKDAN